MIVLTKNENLKSKVCLYKKRPIDHYIQVLSICINFNRTTVII